MVSLRMIVQMYQHQESMSSEMHRHRCDMILQAGMHSFMPIRGVYYIFYGPLFHISTEWICLIRWALMPHHWNAWLHRCRICSDHDLDFLPLTLKTFKAMPTHMLNICAKFHWNPSTKDEDTASREIGLNGQRMDGQRTFGRMDDGKT